MKPKAPNPFRPLSAFEVLFQYYLGKHCFFISGETGTWDLLFPSRANLQPYHFELFFGKGSERDERFKKIIRRIQREKRSIRNFDNGLVDFFTPVFRKGRYWGVLVSGPVLAQCPNSASLRAHWKHITGRSPSDQDPDYLHFVKLILSHPILDEAGLQAISRSLELLGLWIQNAKTRGVKEELEELLTTVFSPRLPHPYWVDWMIGTDKFFSKGERDNPISPWVRRELGLTRVPTMAVAMIPRTTVQAGPVENLCLARAFQHEAYLASRRVAETAARPLGDYGIVLLTSADPDRPPKQQQTDLRSFVESFCGNLDKKVQSRIYAGMGRLALDPADLSRSYQEATAALQLAVQTEKNIITTDPGSPPAENPSSLDLRSLVRGLVNAFGLSSATRLKIAQDRFLRQLVYSGQDQSITKVNLVSALNAVLDKFERDPAVDTEWSKRLTATLFKDLDEARTPPDMVQAFRRSLDILVRYQQHPREAEADTLIRTIHTDIEKDPGRPWKLKGLCQRSGLSAPTFLKRFQVLTGERFGPFLRRIRMDRAKELLRAGHLGLERVAQETGYSSASSFVQAFRRVHQKSPRNFRPQT